MDAPQGRPVSFSKAGRRLQKGVREGFRQFTVLLYKNFLLAKRNWTATLLRLLLPSVWLLILFVVQQALYNNSEVKIPGVTSVPNGVPRCTNNTAAASTNCITIAYAPNNTMTNSIMQHLGAINQPVLSQEDFLVFKTRDDLFEYTMRNLSADTEPWISFGVWFAYSPDNNTVSLDIYLNETSVFESFVQPDVLLPDYHDAFWQLLNRAIISWGMSFDTTPTIETSIGQWPIVAATYGGYANDDTSNSVTFLGQFYGIFFFFGFFLYFPITISEINRERRLKLREGMEVMGLKVGVYWYSWLTTQSVYTLLSSIIFCIIGLILPHMQFFRLVNFVVLVLTFWLFSLSLVTFGFFFSTIAWQPKWSNFWSFMVFLTSATIIMCYSIQALGFRDALWLLRANRPHLGKTIGETIVAFDPIFNFAEMNYQLTSQTIYWYNQTSGNYGVNPDGYSFSDLFKFYCADCSGNLVSAAPNGARMLGLMFMNIVFYYLLAWYLDQVIKNEHGVKQSNFFFLDPDFWGFAAKGASFYTATYKAHLLHSVLPDMDPDVTREYQNTVNVQPDERGDIDKSGIVLRSIKISKTYAKTKASTSEDTRALDSLCINGEMDSILCILGHNGAGKTTAINCITGLESATAGDALIYGYSIRTDLNKIRRVMGVCPQHDILWPELTAAEHLYLYSCLKGVPQDRIKEEVDRALADVKLTSVGHHTSQTFSGGMKRRLSLAISFLANPKIVFLDEPTSGMDPSNRRNVWDVIERSKKGRIIVLTTHSMEEADVLGDKIAILALGRLRAIGDSLHLKNRFGSGYHISVITAPENSENIKTSIKETLPAIRLELESVPGNLNFALPFATVEEITNFFKYIDAAKADSIVQDWGISHTTLEEVFLRITHGDPNKVSLLEDNMARGPAGIYQRQLVGRQQLNIIVEGATSPIGFVEIDDDSTLSQVRNRVVNLDNAPKEFVFLSKGVPVARKQEETRQAVLCLPVLAIRPEGHHHHDHHDHHDAPYESFSSTSANPPKQHPQPQDIQSALLQRDHQIEQLNMRIAQEMEARRAIQAENERLKRELELLRSQSQSGASS